MFESRKKVITWQDQLKALQQEPTFTLLDEIRSLQADTNKGIKVGTREVEFSDSAEPHICLYSDDTEIILTQSVGYPVVPNRNL